jgi:hypothetical protein
MWDVPVVARLVHHEGKLFNVDDTMVVDRTVPNDGPRPSHLIFQLRTGRHGGTNKKNSKE